MFFAGLRHRSMGCLGAKVGQGGFVARHQALVNPVAEGTGPVGFRRSRRSDTAQIVDKAARSQHQYIVSAQLRQLAAQRDVMRCAQMALHRKLHHRHIGLRIHQHQRHPGAVIQPAHGINAAANQRADLARQQRVTRRGIAQIVQRRRKAAKIMDGAVHRHRIGHGRGRIPMRRHRHNAARLAKTLPQPAQEIARRHIVKRQGRGAMGNKDRGQHQEHIGMAPALFNPVPAGSASAVRPPAPARCGWQSRWRRSARTRRTGWRGRWRGHSAESASCG